MWIVSQFTHLTSRVLRKFLMDLLTFLRSLKVATECDSHITSGEVEAPPWAGGSPRSTGPDKTVSYRQGRPCPLAWPAHRQLRADVGPFTEPACPATWLPVQH